MDRLPARPETMARLAALKKELSRMSLIRIRYIRAIQGLGVCFAWMALALAALAQSISTTTVQGTVYLANGSPGSGTLQISWPAFTTASNQTVAAGKIAVSIGADGFVSVDLAPNLGSSPAGLYYTAVYNLSNGTTNTEYWPGDALSLNAPSANLNAQVIVRTVKLTYAASCPDLVQYAISFANDWADDLAIKTSATVPADAWLPAEIAPTYSPNLNALAVTSISGNNVTINTGAAPPSGGGFEIRRRDNCFLPGEDPDLVMRGSQQTMTFARVSASDRFYIRMYDGSVSPNYSEFSAALSFNLPLQQ